MNILFIIIIFRCETSWLKHTLLKTHSTTYMITKKTVLLLSRNQNK